LEVMRWWWWSWPEEDKILVVGGVDLVEEEDDGEKMEVKVMVLLLLFDEDGEEMEMIRGERRMKMIGVGRGLSSPGRCRRWWLRLRFRERRDRVCRRGN